MTRPPRVMITAGEASGDRLGAGLARALRARRGDIELFGMGGPRMEEAGVRLVQPAAEISVVGIWEVLGHLPAIRRAMRRLEATLETERPDLLVPVDFPDFNLRLAARAGRANLPVVYFVSPQVWAWRRRRVKKIRRLVRRMLVLFPFETAFYERAGVPVSFVGHPFAEAPAPVPSRERLCANAGLDPERPVVALMPGSRRGEVGRHLSLLLETARLLAARDPGLQFLLPVAPDLGEGWIESLLDAPPEGLRLLAGAFPEVLTVCEAGAVAAGTASLEAALTGLPLVVFYRMSPATYALGRLLVNLEDVALPNLIAGRRVVPELIQHACTPSAIADEIGRYLTDPERSERVRRELQELRGKLGGPGVYDRAAEAVLEEIESVQQPVGSGP